MRATVVAAVAVAAALAAVHVVAAYSQRVVSLETQDLGVKGFGRVLAPQAASIDGLATELAASAPESDDATVFVYQFDSIQGSVTGRQVIDPTTYPELDIGHGFGKRLQLAGNTLIVGNPSGTGQVHVFTRPSPGSTWTHVQAFGRVVLATEDTTPRFADAISLSSDEQWLVVGAPGQKTAGGAVGDGVAYFYKRNQDGMYDEVTGSRLTGSDEELGQSVAVHSDGYALVTRRTVSPLPVDVLKWDSGAGQWSQLTTLNYSPTPSTEAHCGYGFVFERGASKRILGACIADDNTGTVFVYNYLQDQDTWSLDHLLRLPASERVGGAGDYFGGTTDAIDGQAVSSATRSGSPLDSGLAKMFLAEPQTQGWTDAATFDLSSEEGEREGTPALLTPSLIAIGARYSDSLGPDHGTVRLLHLDCPAGQQFTPNIGDCASCPADQFKQTPGSARCRHCPGLRVSSSWCVTNPVVDALRRLFGDAAPIIVFVVIPVFLCMSSTLITLAVIGRRANAHDRVTPDGRKRGTLAAGLAVVKRRVRRRPAADNATSGIVHVNVAKESPQRQRRPPSPQKSSPQKQRQEEDERSGQQLGADGQVIGVRESQVPDDPTWDDVARLIQDPIKTNAGGTIRGIGGYKSLSTSAGVAGNSSGSRSGGSSGSSSSGTVHRKRHRSGSGRHRSGSGRSNGSRGSGGGGHRRRRSGSRSRHRSGSGSSGSGHRHRSNSGRKRSGSGEKRHRHAGNTAIMATGANGSTSGVIDSLEVARKQS